MKTKTAITRTLLLGLFLGLVTLAPPAQGACYCTGKCWQDPWTLDWSCGFGFVQCQGCYDQIGICAEYECGRAMNLVPSGRNSTGIAKLACKAPDAEGRGGEVEARVLAVERIPSRT